MSIKELAHQIDNLSYDEKKRLYTICFSSGYFPSGNLNDKLAIISLVGLSVSKLKLQNPKMTTLEFLSKVTGVKEENNGWKYIEAFSILVDDM